MANDLTGDFDVVAEFAVPAVNRVLAAMHRVERFPHSLAMRVDDTPPDGSPFGGHSVVGVVDAFGDTVADHARIGNPRPLNHSPGLSTSASSVIAALDPVVNLHVSGVNIDPVVPSNLKGRAQLQLFPPTIEIADTSGTKVTVKIEIISRYLPDPGTPPVAEFIRGDLRITAQLNQDACQGANVVSIDIKADTAIITFTPHWSSRPISAEDLSAIVLLIRNALKTSFLPSNAPLPSKIAHLQFKTFTGSHSAVAVLLDLAGPPGTPTPAGNPASAHTVFLSGSDGFAFGVGADYVRAQLQPTLDTIRNGPIAPVTVPIDLGFATYHPVYEISMSTVTLDLQNGQMVLTMTGHAHTARRFPDFNFTATQVLTLSPNGPTANLVLGAFDFSTNKRYINAIKGAFYPGMVATRDRVLDDSGAVATVAKLLSADENLGGFLKSLLVPPRGSASTQPVSFDLSYSAAEIRTSGIVLHGSVGVPVWPPPHVEFEKIAPSGSGPGGIHGHENILGQGTDYSAFKSWIPGGTIDSYEWHTQGAAQGYNDPNRFVRFHQGLSAEVGAAIAASLVLPFTPLCLTVHGTRLTASGAITDQPVGATVCGYTSFPVGGDFDLASGGVAPLFALTRSGPDGNVEVTGHANAATDASGRSSPNLVVHFADERTSSQLELLTQALRESGRADAATAIVVVMDPAQLEGSRFVEGITYAEDADGVWRRRLGAASGTGATTAIVDPGGKVLWRGEGAIDPRALSEMLGRLLVARKSVPVRLLSAAARIGHLAPNFLFDCSPDLQVTFRKVAGRPTVLVFWRSASRASIEAVRDATSSAGNGKARAQMVFAINDGDSPETLRGLARELGDAIVVPDPDRKISLAYGISMWPTTLSIDEGGVVRTLSYGRAAVGRSVGGKAGA